MDSPYISSFDDNIHLPDNYSSEPDIVATLSVCESAYASIIIMINEHTLDHASQAKTAQNILMQIF